MDNVPKKRGPKPGSKMNKMIHVVKPTDIYKKCNICKKIGKLKNYDISFKNNKFIYYNGKCKKCRLTQIREQRRNKKEKELEKNNG